MTVVPRTERLIRSMPREMVKTRILLGLGACLPLTSLTNSVGYQLMAGIGHRALCAVAT
jgi:hypothetical protein